jgi:hypothetical protein
MQILIIAIAAAVSVAAGFLAVSAAPGTLFMTAGFLAISVVAFLSPKLSLVLLIFSMLLSPEISMGAVAGGRSAVIRYDDILLIIIFFSWFARTAILKDKPFVTSTPVQVPVMAYAALAIVSTGLGIMRGNIRADVAVFYVLKYIEYFLLYFMTVNVIDSKEEIRKYLKYAGLVVIIVTVYAYYYYFNSGPDARASAPFEAPLGDLDAGEPASLGGYYLLVFGFLFALITEVPGAGLVKVWPWLLFVFPAFLLTFSRSSYLGFIFLVGGILVYSRRRKALIALALAVVAGGVFLLPGLSDKVSNRISMTYKGDYATSAVKLGSSGQILLEESAAARVNSLHYAFFERFPKHPLLGWGVTGIGLGDTQYALILGEMGLAGVFVFFWMLYRVFASAKKVYAFYEEPWIKALGLGLMCSIPALLAQGFGVNNFIIVRIMEPFWFITAIVAFLYSRIPGNAAGVPARPEPR